MAKRKKVTRRRRVGAAKGSNMERLLGLVAGAAVTGFAGKLVPADLENREYYIAGGSLLAGYFLPGMAKNNKLIQGIGDGMVAAGGFNLLTATGVLGAFPAVSGYEDMRRINGLPPQIENFQVEPDAPKMNFGMSGVINGMQGRYEESRLG